MKCWLIKGIADSKKLRNKTGCAGKLPQSHNSNNPGFVRETASKPNDSSNMTLTS